MSPHLSRRLHLPIRRMLAALVVALASVLLLTQAPPQPAQAAGYWPYPTSAPALQKMPSRCNLPLVSRTRACTGYLEYRDAFWDVQYGGPNSQAGVTSLLALSTAPGDAAAIGRHAYYNRDRCSGVVRAQAMWMLNDMRDQGQLVDRMSTVLWVAKKASKGPVKVYWKPTREVMKSAAALGKKERFRQQADKVRAGAFATDCA